MSDDGNILAIGAPYEDSSATGINGDQDNNDLTSAGAVYVFVRNNDTWTQQAYLKTKDHTNVGLFGKAVNVSGDGKTIAVGETQASGAVYLY